MFNDYSDVVNVKELCEMLKISKKKAYELLTNGTIPYKKIGRLYRISKISIIKFINNESEEQ